MARWVKVSTISEVPPGGMKGFKVGGREVLLANAEGTYYAARDRCPHLGWRLSGGTLEGRVVICPGHGSRFDLATGQVVAWASRMPRLLAGVDRRLRRPRPLTTYKVRVEGDAVLVEM